MAYEPVQRIELVLLEKVGEFRAIVLIDFHPLGRDVDIYVCLDRHKLVAEPDVVPGLLELRFLPRSQLVQMLVDLFHGTVFRDQLAGSDLSDSFDSRHIVGRVPADGQHVDDLLWRLDSVLFTDFLDADDLVVKSALSWLVLPDVRLDQLPVILVWSHHVDIQPFPGAAFGH